MKPSFPLFALYAIVAVGVLGFVRNGVFGGSSDRPLFWIRKYDEHGPFGLIAAGDSRTYRSIDPSQFATVVFRPVNFAFSGLGYSRTYLEHVDRLIDRRSGSEILLGITPNSLTPRASRANGYLDVARMKPAERELAALTEPIGRQVEPMTFQEFVANSISAARGDQSAYIQEFHPDGFVASDRRPRMPDKNLEAQKRLYVNNKVSPEIIANLLGFVTKWRSEGIAVYAFWPPASVAVTEVESTESGFDKVSFVRDLERAGGEWIEIPPTLDTYDGNHLTYDSARKITKMIKGRIAVRQGAGE